MKKRQQYLQKVSTAALLGSLLLSACPKPTKVTNPDGVGTNGLDAFNANSKVNNNKPQRDVGSPVEPPTPTLRGLPADKEQESVILKALTQEMERAKLGLAKEKLPPYFIGYEVIERQSVSIQGNLGVLEQSTKEHTRYLNLDLRVGEYALDNTHGDEGLYMAYADAQSLSRSLPLDDDIEALRVAIWKETENKYQGAAKRLESVKTAKAIRVTPDDDSDDFSREKPVRSVALTKSLAMDQKAWEAKIRKFSKLFLSHPNILLASVSLNVEVVNRYIVNTEGTTLQFSSTHARISIYGATRADDGMDLERFEAFDAETLERLPSDAEIEKMVNTVIKDIEALRVAPLAEPYTGPAILGGKATGVFFHEIFGHRMEGHRQKSEEEGQTFTKKLNESVMPSFISVFDDPNAAQLQGVDLNGYYPFDDQGVPAQRASLVQDGILKGFLLARSPIKGFPTSNGHGRRQEGYPVVSRQGNLMVNASFAVSDAKLREMLREEAKRQEQPYGLFFEDISGGFTNTGRSQPQAFKVLPVMVYRIYADGRPDELIRGVDIVGTPLTALGQILAASTTYETFNGFCGAESGFVPVSASGPGLLIEQIETERREKGQEAMPILPAPGKK
jgi:TldD protein